MYCSGSLRSQQGRSALRRHLCKHSCASPNSRGRCCPFHPVPNFQAFVGNRSSAAGPSRSLLPWFSMCFIPWLSLHRDLGRKVSSTVSTRKPPGLQGRAQKLRRLSSSCRSGGVWELWGLGAVGKGVSPRNHPLNPAFPVPAGREGRRFLALTLPDSGLWTQAWSPGPETSLPASALSSW